MRIRLIVQMLIVIIALALGGFGVWMGGSAIVSGRTDTLTRTGKTVIIERARHPGIYWYLTTAYSVGGLLVTWFAVWLFWASLRENRRIDGGVALYKRLRNDQG